MKLTKVIEIMEINLKEAGKKMPPDCRTAVQISIEAVKRVKRTRNKQFPIMGEELPGETKED